MKKRILFVCLGNICRSPAAEAVMKDKLNSRGLSGDYFVDSAGIIGFHEGEQADSRMRKHALKRGIHLTSLSRPVRAKQDFQHFDLIIGMDDQNIRDLKSLSTHSDDLNKIRKMTDFCSRFSHSTVPDPYYGGEEGFELVLDLLDDACEGLIDHLEG